MWPTVRSRLWEMLATDVPKSLSHLGLQVYNILIFFVSPILGSQYFTRPKHFSFFAVMPRNLAPSWPQTQFIANHYLTSILLAEIGI